MGRSDEDPGLDGFAAEADVLIPLLLLRRSRERDVAMAVVDSMMQL
jgi:hypothetical protein